MIASLLHLLLLSQAPATPQNAPAGGAWRELHAVFGTAFNQQVGEAVAAVGDVDGDGVPDFALGCKNALSSSGLVLLHSGATGTLIRQLTGSLPGEQFGISVAGVGDVDGDGVDDICVGANHADPPTAQNPAGLQNAGSAYLISGATGLQVRRIDGLEVGDFLGSRVAGIGDIDLDGIADIAIAAANANPAQLPDAGSVYLYSGSSGALILRLDGEAPFDYFGSSISGAGDLDGDTVPDLWVGAAAADPNGMSSAGRVYALSGASGLELYRIDGQAAGEGSGAAVAAVGDLDGDQITDVLVGSYAASPGGMAAAGLARVHSGAAGTQLQEWTGENPDNLFGHAVSGLGDVDGDGIPDLAVGAYLASFGGDAYVGFVNVYSGADFRRIGRFQGDAEFQRLGQSIAGLGDLDGDGRGEIALGSPGWASTGVTLAGRAQVYTLAPFLTLSAAELSVAGAGDVVLALDFPVSEAGIRYAILASLSGTGSVTLAGLEIPLHSDPLFQYMVGSNPPAAVQGSRGTLDANGDASAALLAGPSLAPVIGQVVHFAAVSFDLAPLQGRLSSMARAVRILP